MRLLPPAPLPDVCVNHSLMKSEINGTPATLLRSSWRSLLALAMLAIPMLGAWELLRMRQTYAIRVSHLLVVFFVFEVFAIAWLITEYLRSRQLLSDSNIARDRLRIAMTCGKSVGWEWDLASGRDYWFGDLQNMFGIQSDTWSGPVDEFFRYVHHEDRQHVAQAVTDARINHTMYAAEFRVVRQDGAIRWVTATGSFYYAKSGQPQRMIGMAVDITERKRAEQTLRESEQRFRLVANTAPVMIWMSSPDKLCNYFNQQWLDFTGRPLEAELGNGWAEAVHPEDLQACLHGYTDAFDKRQSFEMQYRLRRHDGQYRWIEDKGVPRFETEGSFAGYIGSCNDVTDRKLATEMLGNLGRRLVEAQEQERTWIARELHDDINQRLALLAIELEEWKRHGSESSIDFGAHIEQVRQRLFEISKDVQALSHRLHSSKLEYLGIAPATKSFCRELSEQHKVRIEFSYSDMPRNVPSTLSLAFFRVLQEALHNAVKHSHAKEFRVELRGTPDELHLTISDPGIGFDQVEVMGGRGLGLISMRERLQLVNGRLAIESKPGHGTTIRASVPIKAAAESPELRQTG